MKHTSMIMRTGAITGLLALTLTACGSDGGDTEDDANAGDTAAEDTDDSAGDDTDESADAGGEEAAGGGEGGTITLGIIPSWTDGLSTAYLWKNVLEGEGYEVEITEIADAGLLYTGVANGDIDIYPSAWPEVTHASYMEEYGDQLEDLGAYYENAKLTFAVPEYTEISSIADLADNVDMFGGEIIGIEPGAGLTKATKESVMPTYGLDDYTLVESSTTAMLTELGSAIDNQEDIVVTLWRPFWANSEFPVKDLEDPEGALGEPETLNAIATAGFSEEFPEVAEMFGNFTLDDDAYGSLEDTVVNEYGGGQEAEAIEAWLEANPDFIGTLTS
ncbi:glycine betaine ABC transporter substrate-binding protein [Ornithinimicrobium cryptoxanthini]|uniref:Glycine betaine ABC transporter substrate-binding protein n=1 Tax=Ornithinimicrobium cryptoxanthini TaxID=2934161 RepID=A0ABY4YIC5_9MICO|nr:glycine betaine ABC transporter substrate-binding protein [Ornithinimicrobium cryptoxanthini]USQ76541.1 glycine betaine ABC transporter substrate-binding protein [Ornithinimicrobium cryptoxanthini]